MRIKTLLGLGALAGAAFAAFKLVEKFDEVKDGEWTAMMGDMPENVTVETPEMAEVLYPEDYAPTPNVNPVEAPPVHTEKAEKLDPTQIALAEDFQNWDELGCQS
ncbi:MAG: hypothetical protein RSB47_09060 [Ruthenibacterium sp.]